MPVCDAQAQSDHVMVNPDVVGAKRKHEGGANNAMDLDQEVLPVKRQCVEMPPDLEGDSGVVLGHSHQQQFMMPSQPSPLASVMPPISQGGDIQVYGCMKDVIGSGAPGDFIAMTLTPPHHPNPPAPTMPVCMQSEGGRGESIRWMDMDGETYCPLVSNMDVETAVMSATPLLCSSPPPTLPHHPHSDPRSSLQAMKGGRLCGACWDRLPSDLSSAPRTPCLRIRQLPT